MRRRASLAALLAAAACSRPHATPGATTAAHLDLKTEDQRTAYAFGLLLGKNVAPLKLSPEEVDVVAAGVRDEALGRSPQVDLAIYGPRAQQLANERRAAAQAAVASEQAAKDASFLKSAAAEAGAVTLPSGAVFKELAAGQGPSAVYTDTVSYDFEGALTDGTVFDGTKRRGAPLRASVSAMLPCVREALLRLKVGGRGRIVCPASLGYGDRGRLPLIPGGAALVFQVGLVEINPPPPPPLPPRFRRQGR